MTVDEAARALRIVARSGLTVRQAVAMHERNVELMRRSRAFVLDPDRLVCNTLHRLPGLTDRPVVRSRRA